MRTAPLSVLLLPLLTVALVLPGCASNRKQAPKPEMTAGEGAISGQLVDPVGDPFDLRQADDETGKKLRIDLISPGTGVAAAAYPTLKESRFVFSHVKPGQYEIQVYWTVPGKRAIAGSLPVAVNPAEVAPVKLPLTVTPVEGAK